MIRSRSFVTLVIALLAFGLIAPPGVALADDGDKGKFPKEHRERLSGDSDGWLFGKGEIDSHSERQSNLRESERERQTQTIVGANVQVNAPQQAFPNGLLGRSETTIAATRDGKKLVAGFNDAQGFCGPPFGSACTPQTPPGLSGFAFSTNGGTTWTDGGAPDPALGPNVLTRGDPWLASGKDETFFYANLAVHPTTGADLGVSVHRGRFRGSSFAWNDVRVLAPPRGEVRDFYDKEAIATDPKDDDNAVVTVTNFQELCNIPQNGFGQIEVWRTRNGGNTWQGPVVAGPEAPDSMAACGNTGTLQQSSVPAFGPKGEVYVVWQFGPTFTATTTSTDARVVVARSLDRGATFGAPVTVAAINSFRQDTQVGYNRDRQNDHPRIAVATSGKHRGRVFVAFYSAVAPVTAAAVTPCPAPNVGSNCRAQRLTSSQAFVSHSDDAGRTWSTPAPVAPAPPASGIKRFWPVVTVGTGDDVNVVFQESQERSIPGGADCNVNLGGGLRRRGPAHSFVDTFVATSSDGGQTFGAPVRVSTVTSDWCTAVSNVRPNFGDYIGSTAARNDDNSFVLATWADGRNGVPDTFFAPIRIGREEEDDDD